MRENLTVVLLVAGRGTRLGGDLPKCLTPLREGGETILDRQLRCLAGVANPPLIAVVGHRKEFIEAAHPELRQVFNERYAETNTARSLLCALRDLAGKDVLWLNGDVVFVPEVVSLMLRGSRSCMAVNRARCAEEEVKYATGPRGNIVAVSKQARPAEGEAVGINLVKAADLPLFRECLEACADMDYFERGLELAIQRGLMLYPVDIGDLPCIEVDFPEDLEKAREMFRDGAGKGEKAGLGKG
jgi:choline kinase